MYARDFYRSVDGHGHGYGYGYGYNSIKSHLNFEMNDVGDLSATTISSWKVGYKESEVMIHCESAGVWIATLAMPSRGAYKKRIKP
jgi:hypothetical protein